MKIWLGSISELVLAAGPINYVKRGLFVYAVDHGKMAASLTLILAEYEHCPEDGFKFQPPKRKHIDWLVCDMVEQPSRLRI